MAHLSPDKLRLLKKAFIEDTMQPGQAADTVGVTYVTAKGWYDKLRRCREANFDGALADSTSTLIQPVA